MDEAEKRRISRESRAESYTNPPVYAPPPRGAGRSGAGYAAAAVVLLILAGVSAGLHRTADPASSLPAHASLAAQAPAPEVQTEPAPPVFEPPAPARTPAPRVSSLDLARPGARAASTTARYLLNGFNGPDKLPEPEDALPRRSVLVSYYDPAIDGWPVAGDAVDVVVDGRPERVKLQPAAEPGKQKAVVRWPLDGRPHTAVFTSYFDLGSEGLVKVVATVIQDERGKRRVFVESPVDRIDIVQGEPRRALRLKN